MCNSNWFQTEPAVKVNMMTDEANLSVINVADGVRGVFAGGVVLAV